MKHHKKWITFVLTGSLLFWWLTASSCFAYHVKVVNNSKKTITVTTTHHRRGNKITINTYTCTFNEDPLMPILSIPDYAPITSNPLPHSKLSLWKQITLTFSDECVTREKPGRIQVCSRCSWLFDVQKWGEKWKKLSNPSYNCNWIINDHILQQYICSCKCTPHASSSVL